MASTTTSSEAHTAPEAKLLDRTVGPIGFGLMNMTWRASPPPREQCFGAMDAALAAGSTFWNGGELYGTPKRNSTHLLAEYFAERPGVAEKVVVSIKGGLARGEMRPDGSAANVRRSVEDSLAGFNGTKKAIDIFECARVDPNTPIEETMTALRELQDEGKILGIGLSEVKALTIKRAAAVATIAAVEVELSLWATDVLRNGVAATCAELNIPLVAYSPLCRGALTSKTVRRNADIPDDDHRKHMPKFQDEVLEQNNRLTDAISEIADRKHATKPQIALAWVRALSGRKLADGTQLPVIIPIPGATSADRVNENMVTSIQMSEEEMDEIWGLLEKYRIVGERYGGPGARFVEG